MRDALAQLCRVFFERDEPQELVSGWDATCTPMLLDAASRFGRGEGPLVWVFVTQAEISDSSSHFSAADWRRARLVRVPQAGDVRVSVRNAIASLIDLRAAIFIGGTDDHRADADAVGSNVPRFAVASTGGTAASLPLSRGSQSTAPNPALQGALAHATSYLLLMRDLLAHI